MGIVLDIILPVFGLVVLGFAAAKLNWFDDTATRGLSLFVFNFAIPVLLFRSLATTDLPADIPWTFLVAFYAGGLAVFAINLMIARTAWRRAPDEAAVFGLAAAFSNTVLLGIPLVLTTFGDRASLPLFLLIAFHVPVYLPLATSLAEAYRGRGGTNSSGQAGTGARSGGGLAILRATAVGLVTNPIILGLAAGLLWNLTGAALPDLVDAIASHLAAAAVPCSLFALGASVARFRLAGQIGQAMGSVVLKTLVHPALVWALGALVFDLEPLWLGVAVLLAAMPAGANVYLFAQRYGVCIGSAATTVLVSTGVSIGTISILLYMLPGT